MTISIQPPRQRGFTLIELMIVVAIVGILSAIAYPSYVEYVRKGHRAEARTGLLQAAQWLERAATATGSYPTTLPGSLQAVPGNRYDISFKSSSTTAFTLQAAPKGAQLGDKCGTYELEHNGKQNVTSGTVAECWSK